MTKTIKSSKRFLSLALAVLMIMSIMVPAYAATPQHTIAVSYDGNLQYRNGYNEGSQVSIPLYTTGEKDVESITITSGEYVKVIEDFSTAVKDTLGGKTTYTLTAAPDANESKVFTLVTTGLKDDISVSVVTKAAEYTVMANSGTYGENSNYGGTGSSTCVIEKAEQTVAGGAGYSVTFTPNAGLEITHLNIRANYTNRTNLVAVSTASTTVAAQTFTVSKNAETGAVTVTCTAAKHDMFITALTQNLPTKYTLSVSTDAYLTSDTASVVLNAGTTRNITLTAVSGYCVNEVRITDGGQSGTIGATGSSVKVNGHSYALVRNVNGSATLSVPAMAADVKIEVTSATGRNYILVHGSGLGADFDTNYSTLTYLGDNEAATVVINPDDYTVISQIVVASARGTVYVEPDAEYFYIGSTIYRVGHEGDTVYLYLNPMPGSTEITVSTKSTANSVTLSADNGATYVGDRVTNVLDGEDLRVTFKPQGNWQIQRLTITYGGQTYNADVSRDYITVNGSRWPITVQANGKVSLDMRNINANVQVKAVTNYYVKTNSIVKTDSVKHVTVTTNPETVKANDKVVITLRPDAGYDMETVKIVDSYGRTYTLKDDSTKDFKVGSTSFDVARKATGVWTLTTDRLYREITISTTTVQDDKFAPSDYHEAYMYGVGGGKFAPEANMTRAEAVTLMARLFSGETDRDLAKYDTYSSFKDVGRNDWFAPYIVWAEDEGILDDLYGAKTMFRPNDAITRAEFVDLLCRFTGGYDDSYRLNYTDVTWAHWAAGQIAYATEMGWVKGHNDGRFGADDNITRAQVATLMNRVMHRDAKAVFLPSYMHAITFVDVPANHWAFTDIVEATNTHTVSYTTGAGEFWE